MADNNILKGDLRAAVSASNERAIEEINNFLAFYKPQKLAALNKEKANIQLCIDSISLEIQQLEQLGE